LFVSEAAAPVDPPAQIEVRGDEGCRRLPAPQRQK
jgi:hypothetical protein